MALTFNCPNCGEEITAKFLRKGEQCLCRDCNHYFPVPADARPSGEESSLVKKVSEQKGYSEFDTINKFDRWLAGRGERLAAFIIDVLIIYAVYIIIFGIFATLDLSFENASDTALVALIFIPLLPYTFIQWYFLSVRGQSIGKIVMKIKIVRYKSFKNGGFVYNVLLREVLNGTLGIIPLYGLVDIIFIFGDKKRCIHDYIAGTIVVPVDFVPPEYHPFTGEPTQSISV